MDRVIKNISVSLLTAFVLTAVVVVIMEVNVYREFARSLPTVISLSLRSAIENTQEISSDEPFNYYSEDFVHFVDNITANTTEFDSLKLLRPGNSQGYYYRATGISPLTMGITYLDPSKLKMKFLDSLEVNMKNKKNVFSFNPDSLEITIDYQKVDPNSDFARRVVFGGGNASSIDTAINNSKNTNTIIVAKVVVHMECTIPYQSKFAKDNFSERIESIDWPQYYWVAR